MAFERKWPPKVDRAIREGVASGMRTKDILSALHAGTLPALNDDPQPIPERTFYELLRRAKAKVAAGVKPKPEAPPLEARLLAAQGGTPAQIRERLEARGTDPKVIDAAVDEARERQLAEQRDRDERDRIKALASEGLTVEQIREATGLTWRELKDRLTELFFGEPLSREERIALGELKSWITADKLRGQPEPVRAPGDYGPPARK